MSSATPEPRSALAGFRVVELSHERGAWAGKLLADMGADVIVVEPTGGDPARRFAPFLDDEPGPDRSLYWWHYNTSKRGVSLDLELEAGRDAFRRLVASADVLIECEPPGRLAALGLDWPDLKALRPQLVMVSITPYGRSGPNHGDQATDLTILAAGGPVWSCGYDDHSIPPVRGGGNQGHQTACHFAVASALVALLARERTGRGQHIDVNMHAAANVTTEAGSYDWLVARSTVLRQTGRHAAHHPTMDSQVRCADGRWVNTGVPPRTPAEFGAVLEWVRELGLEEDFPEAALLELGMKRERIDLAKLGEDHELGAIFGAGRDAMNRIAASVSAYDFFIGAQRRGIAVGVIYAPEDVMEDPHFVARGFRVEVDHPELGRRFVYPGAPYRFTATPWRIQRRAPRLGEHNTEVFGALGLGPAEIAALSQR